MRTATLGLITIILCGKELGSQGSKSQVPKGPGPRPLLTLSIMLLVFHKELCSLTMHLCLGQALDWFGSQQLGAERFEMIAQKELFFLL